jgi:uncharacterized protein (TIGR00255 family)
MTGFGRLKCSWQNKTIIVEIKSLNSKSFDLRNKTPQNYRNKEADIRKILNEKFERGKIDLILEIQSESDEPQNLINKGLFEKYYRELNQLKNDLGIGDVDFFQSILRLPNIVETGEEEFSEEEWEKVLRHRKIAYREGVRDGVACGAVLTVVFAYIWCHFGWTT